jgi:predicted amidohydrolase
VTTRDPGHESVITVAAIQTRAVTGDKQGNNERATEAIHRACDAGARVLVLPELGNSGYVFRSRDEVAELAEPVGGETTRLWESIARERDVYICGGMPEVENGRYFNSGVLVGPFGFIGRYRKAHLWHEEKLFFEPGDLGINVFDLPFGRVGMMICYDGWHPEVARILKLKGADLILDPTCWVLVPDVITPENPVSAYVHMAMAHLNSVFIVCADQCGVERGCTFLGRSCVAGPAGFVAGPAAFEDPEIVLAEINVVAARYHHWTALANPFADRRTDLFDPMLGYRDPPAAAAAFSIGADLEPSPRPAPETRSSGPVAREAYSLAGRSSGR